MRCKRGLEAALVTMVGLGGCAEDLDYAACDQADLPWLLSSPDASTDEVLDDADTERFAAMLQGSFDAAGYGDSVEVLDAAMIRVDIWTRFCVDTLFRVDWFAARTRTCFDRQLEDNDPFDDAAMTYAFDQHVASFPDRPGSIVTLKDVKKAANGCHRRIFETYEPCSNAPTRPQLELTFQQTSNERECGETRTVQTVTVDLVSGSATACETFQEPVCPDGMG